MWETNESANGAVKLVKDAVRYLGDASYAVLPEDVAHRLADLKKSFLGGVKWLLDKEVEWIDARVEGGDRLRDEWRQRRDRQNGAGEGI